MKTAANPVAPVLRQVIPLRPPRPSTARRWQAALLVSLTLGALMAIFGAVLSFLELLGLLAGHRWMSSVGVLLLASAFPTAMFAAHCIDKGHEAERANERNAARFDL